MLKRSDFVRRLQKRPIVADGAMGTMLYERGIFINRCFDEVNLNQPDIVAEILAAYRQAGAELLKTNTFGAHEHKLAGFGLKAQAREINVRAAQIAKDVAGDYALVAGVIGPLGLNSDSNEWMDAEDIKANYHHQVLGLIEGGVDLLLLETQESVEQIEAIIELIRDIDSDAPIIAQMTFNDDGFTRAGIQLTKAVRQLALLDADVVGINCTVGPKRMRGQLEQLIGATSKPVSVMPNAGGPTLIDGRYIHLSTPEYVASHGKRYVELGARIVGGCCGTTPAHIRQLRNYVRSRSAVRLELPGDASDSCAPESEIKQPLLTYQKSSFAYKLRHGSDFVTSVEVSPPRGANLAATIEHVKELRAAGIDVINIPDGPRAVSRMSPAAMASHLEKIVGMETVLHVTCRDRNLLGLQADLMGLNALGVRNVIVITGDPPKMGDFPHATAVFDVDSIGLVSIISRMGAALDLSGKSLNSAPILHVGVGCEPGALNFDREVDRMAEKLKAGAEFIMTQPVYDVAILERFLSAADIGDTPVLVGILPLASQRNAEFLHNEVPGMRIPDPIRERMRKADNGQKAQAEGVAIAQEALIGSKDLPNVRGFYIMPPLGRYNLALDVLRPIGF